MKKVLLTLLFVLSSLQADIQWMDYKQATEKVKSTENKTIMVMLGRSTCGVCNYMKSVVFRDKNVLKKLNANSLSVYIDLEFDDVPEKLTYIGTPTFHFLDKNEKALHRIDGGKTAPSFLKALNQLHK